MDPTVTKRREEKIDKSEDKLVGQRCNIKVITRAQIAG